MLLNCPMASFLPRLDSLVLFRLKVSSWLQKLFSFSSEGKPFLRHIALCCIASQPAQCCLKLEGKKIKLLNVGIIERNCWKKERYSACLEKLTRPWKERERGEERGTFITKYSKNPNLWEAQWSEVDMLDFGSSDCTLFFFFGEDTLLLQYLPTQKINRYRRTVKTTC